MKCFIIADPHFGDEYINKSERHFSTISAMDKLMIQQWNSVVEKNDMIYVLGDFVGKSKISNEVIADLLEKLNGYKILIMGNHDFEQGFPEDYLNLGFDEVYRHSVIVDGFYIFSHEPVYINKSMPYANIFGHVHGNPLYKDYCSQGYCACAERIQYIPVEFEEVKKIILNANEQGE